MLYENNLLFYVLEDVNSMCLMSTQQIHSDKDFKKFGEFKSEL